MRKSKWKVFFTLLIAVSLMLIQTNTYAHPGRTDARGGHKDNKNKSGLGSYHYHCGGNPAHLHTNGVCPYASSSSSSKSSTSSYSPSKPSSSKTTMNTVPTTIEVMGIQINENINSIKVGESKKLTATIKPDNATDKAITWKSSDESIATINSKGEIVAKKSGTINITARASNGISSIIKINIKEQEKITNNLVINKNSVNNIDNDDITDKQEDSNLFGGILILGILGGCVYWRHKKYNGKHRPYNSNISRKLK